MSVIHLETGRDLYGGALQVLYLVQGLQERGVHSVVMVPKGSEVAVAARKRWLRVEEFPYRGEADVTSLARLAWRFSRSECPARSPSPGTRSRQAGGDGGHHGPCAGGADAARGQPGSVLDRGREVRHPPARGGDLAGCARCAGRTGRPRREDRGGARRGGRVRLAGPVRHHRARTGSSNSNRVRPRARWSRSFCPGRGTGC